MLQTFAHVKWFVEQEPAQAHPLTTAEWAAIAVLVLAGLAVFWWLHRRIERSGLTRYLDKKLGRYSRLIPLIVRYTTGLLLIINAAKGLLFAPNVPVDVVSAGSVMSIVLAVAGVLLLIGWQIRIAALLILAVYATAVLLVRPVVDVLDHFEYLGIGLYLLLFQDAGYLRRLKTVRFSQALRPESLLRISVGFGLMILALSEKLVGITYSTHFLNHHSWNFLQAAGLADRNFIIIAGVIEFLVGLTLVFNLAPRLTTAIVASLMVTTAVLLGIDEVFGHLFALSLVAVVWLRPAPK